MNVPRIKSDLDKIISRGEAVLQRSVADHVKRPESIAVRVSSLSYLKNLLGENHEYYVQFEKHTISGKYILLANGMAILKSLRQDVNDQWLFDIKQLLAAEFFTDFLEMASTCWKKDIKIQQPL